MSATRAMRAGSAGLLMVGAGETAKPVLYRSKINEKVIAPICPIKTIGIERSSKRFKSGPE